MPAARCKVLETHEKSQLLELSHLLDLTDEPVGLRRRDVSWARVRPNAASCICCCSSDSRNAVTLVTKEEENERPPQVGTSTDDFRHLLDGASVESAQVNDAMTQLALASASKLVVVDLGAQHASRQRSNARVVNLAAEGLTPRDLLFWLWLDDKTLALVTGSAVLACAVNQSQVAHPALSALKLRFRLLRLRRLCSVNSFLGDFCQITNVLVNASHSLVLVAGLYSASSGVGGGSSSEADERRMPRSRRMLRANQFGSVPSQLSSLATSKLASLDASARPANADSSSLTSSASSASSASSSSFSSVAAFDSTSLARHKRLEPSSPLADADVYGIVQVYCRRRDLCQLIHAHAVALTNALPLKLAPSANNNNHSNTETEPCILVAASKLCKDSMRVYFVEIASECANGRWLTGQNAAPSTYFDDLNKSDFPSSIVCAHLNDTSAGLHVAFVVTKHCQLFVCSISHSTILFSTNILNGEPWSCPSTSSAPRVTLTCACLDRPAQGLIVVLSCGKVMLLKLRLGGLMKLLERNSSLRHISSSNSVFKDSLLRDQPRLEAPNTVEACNQLSDSTQLSSSLDTGLDVLVSTRL